MGHDHDHGSCSHEHNGVDPAEMGIMYSLYQKIDLDHVLCLNEAVENSAKLIFKSWENRLDKETYLESDCDPELLLNIPFTGNVKLKGIILIGGENGSHPSKIRLFKNRPQMTFDDVSSKADQEFELHRDHRGILEYSTKVVTFSGVHHLSIHVPGNMATDSQTDNTNTIIHYLGLRGEFSTAHKHGVTICNYELLPSSSDVANPLADAANFQVQ